MTTWTTFETIDEMAHAHGDVTIYVDRLGMHGYTQGDRTRFILSRTLHASGQDFGSVLWVVEDLEAEDDQRENFRGTMRECVQFMAGRVLYGA